MHSLPRQTSRPGAGRYADMHVRLHGGHSRRAGQVCAACNPCSSSGSPYFTLATVDTLLKPQRVARRLMSSSRKTARARSGAGLWWAPSNGGPSNGVALNRCPQPATLLTDTRVLPAHTERLHGVSWWSRSSVPVASQPGPRPHGTSTQPAQVALSTAEYMWMPQHARR